ncbi:hypothetical protein [Allorhizocola rhizosphaerae]|uniref:hypothetical protein n=1 Tax=Allorhizocola rhizosphaerae TaxID=1872709 RepID=UPI000E3E2AE2|nr:hypothetical protein [Allorhizocola rhizosphaerae]
MFQTEQFPQLRRLIAEQAARDRAELDRLMAQVRAMGPVRIIKPRSATSVALMAADGGNNQVTFNPFYLQVVRVVDSYGKELCLDVVSSSTDIGELSRQQFEERDGKLPPLGRLMRDLEVNDLHELSPMMNWKSAGWVLVYRELCEWATLYELICSRRFAQDTLLVRDGLLRSKVFRGTLFVEMYRLIKQHIERIYREDRRHVWLVGLAKKSEVLEQYRLAISLSRVFERGSPCFVAVPEEMQRHVIRWVEYVRSPEDDSSGEKPKFNMGAMHFARFGTRSGDPVWTVDLLECQKADAQVVFGYLLADAVAGFPIPFYPNSIQQADSHSRVADLDLDIIEDNLIEAIRDQVGPELAPIIDQLRLATDVAARRYE